MTGTIAIIAALPGELKPLVSPRKGVRWARLKADKGTVLWERRHAAGRWIAACSGMGGARAAEALRQIERYTRTDDPVAAICSVGWAGALDAGLSAGSVWHVSRVIDTQTGERFRTAQWSPQTESWPVLATAARVADAAEKVRLAASYGAQLVDMEAATLARVADARAIPFYCLKAVSDDADAKLPEMNRFILADGRMQMSRFLAHIAVRPGHWRGLAKLGRNSTMAARFLAVAIEIWLEQEG